jgi:uncharacterized membrane protein YebE (DUF533 family)
MDVNIGHDTLVALAAIAWADGKIEATEAAAIRSAAAQLGLNDEELRAVEETLQQPVPLEQVETVRMNRLTRLFTYAVANWIAQANAWACLPWLANEREARVWRWPQPAQQPPRLWTC